GSVSGGCLEGDVVRKGWWRTEGGSPVVVTYDATANEDGGWGFGLGCDGVVDVMLERVDAPRRVDALRFLARCHEAQRRGTMATVFRSDTQAAPVGARLAVDEAGHRDASEEVRDELRDRLEATCADAFSGTAGASTRRIACGGHEVEVLIEPVVPPPRFFVFGSGHDAASVVAIAGAVGWEVVVCEPHGRGGTRERFPTADAVLVEPLPAVAARVDESDRALAVVMSHDYARDRDALAMLLASGASYVGVLGPRRRAARLLDELGMPGALDDPRLHAPVGLAIGAESPHEIALSIVAEAQSVLACGAGTSLRHRSGPIHPGASP
ncbi:MAG TPA: XdhC/CoxI family protein, partial [Polyangiaceae bacterium]